IQHGFSVASFQLLVLLWPASFQVFINRLGLFLDSAFLVDPAVQMARLHRVHAVLGNRLVGIHPIHLIVTVVSSGRTVLSYVGVAWNVTYFDWLVICIRISFFVTKSCFGRTNG